MNRPTVVAMAFALATLVAAIPASGQSAPALQGVVTDASTGTAVGGVTVALCAPYSGGCPATSTDGNGGYSLTGVQLGSLTQGTLYFYKIGYFTHVTAFTIDTTLNATLKAGGPLIQGRVTDTATGMPLANAQVVFQSPAFVQISGTHTDANGQYVFDSSYFRDTAANGFTVTQSFAGTSGYFGSTDNTAFTVAPPYPLTRDFSLQPASGIALQGTVTDAATGAPVGDVSIALCAPYQSCGSSAVLVTTDANGAYSLTGVQLSSLTQGTLYVYKTGYFTHVAAFTINTPLNVSLLGGGAIIQGRVTDTATGMPLANAQVVFQSPAFVQISGTYTDANGQYVLDSSYFRDTAVNGFTVSQSATVANGYLAFTDTTAFVVASPFPLTKDFALTWNGTQFAVVVTTSPTGLPITVDGVSYTSPQSFTWKPSAPHVIATAATVDDGPGSRMSFANWSDGGAISHTVWIGQSPATFTATFHREYFLSASASPAAGGTVAGGGWYAASSPAQVSATPNPGYSFGGFAGDLSAATSPQTVVMNRPKSITANFVALIATTTSFAVTPSPARVGQAVTLAATVTPALAGGSVVFFDNGFPIGTATTDASGVAQLVTSTLTQGTHPLSAGYGGDITHLPSTSAVVSEVVQAATFPQVTLTSSSIDFRPLPVFESTTAATVTGAKRSLDIAAADFNGDGFVDLAVVNYDSTGSVSILLADGKGNFTHVADLPAAASARGITAADVNHDGAVDLIVGSESESAVRVFLGNGAGQFGLSTSWPAHLGPFGVTTADLNRDGSPDIATANLDGTLTMLLGDGGGAFLPPVAYAVGAGNALVAADLDGDGIVDLVTGVSWLRGRGDGTFQPPIAFATRGSGLAVGDFDGDGIADVALIENDNVSHISILHGTGGGGMSAPIEIPMGFWLQSILSADMNGDGLVDLVVSAADYDSSVAVLLNSTTGFRDPVLYGFVGDDEGLAIADVNRDGKPDVTIANLSNTVTVLANEGNGTLRSSRAVLLQDTGTGALDFTSVSITGDDAASFFIEVNSCRGTLNVGSTCTVVVGFRPQTAGSKNGTLEIVDDSPTSPHEIPLTGIATLATPQVTWPTPADIVYGTALSAAQLDAAANVPGTFTYSPAAGTILNAGNGQVLSATFTPTDPSSYATASATININVLRTIPTVSIAGGAFDYDGLMHPAIVTIVGGAGEALAPSLVTYNGQLATPVAAGTYTVNAAFGGDANNLPTSGSATLVINQAGTSVTLTSAPDATSVFGQSVTVTASVASLTSGGAPTGDVTFTADGATIGTATLNGATASIAVSSLDVGAHALTASYAGDANFKTGVSSPTTYEVDPAATATTLTTTPNPSGFGGSVTMTATIGVAAPGAGIPTGTVVFSDGGIAAGSAPVMFDGTTASVTLGTSFIVAGTHSLTASYLGDGRFSASESSVVVQTVNDATGSTTTTLASSTDTIPSGSPLTLSATVNALAGKGTPTGTVEFVDGTVSLGIAPLTASGGKTIASLTTSALATGANALVARYSGDSALSASTSGPIVVTVYDSVAPTTSTTSITTSPNPSAVGDTVTISAVVNGKGNVVPSGTVQFYADGLLLGTSSLQLVKHDMAATLSTNTLAFGEHTLTAVYLGDGTVAGSSSAALLQCVGCTLLKKVK